MFPWTNRGRIMASLGIQIPQIRHQRPSLIPLSDPIMMAVTRLPPGTEHPVANLATHFLEHHWDFPGIGTWYIRPSPKPHCMSQTTSIWGKTVWWESQYHLLILDLEHLKQRCTIPHINHGILSWSSIPPTSQTIKLTRYILYNYSITFDKPQKRSEIFLGHLSNCKDNHLEVFFLINTVIFTKKFCGKLFAVKK